MKYRRSVSSLLASTTLKTIATLASLLVATPSFTQQQPGEEPEPQRLQARADAPSTVTLPAGTRIVLVLTHPILSRNTRRGDDIYAQITSPVSSGTQTVIPPGAFVQGKVDKLEEKSGRGQLHLQSLSITFPDGFVAPVAGPLMIESSEGYALNDPGKGRSIAALGFAAGGAGLGALIGHSLASSQSSTITSTLPPGCTGPPPGCLSSSLTVPPNKGKATAIGAGVGAAAGMVTSILMLTTSHHFFLDVGSPVEMVLQQPLSLPGEQVAEAVRHAEEQPMQPQAIARRREIAPPPPDTNRGTCYTHGTPGTPATVIPGTPGPDGIPGPPTVIPGFPPTPGTSYPCP